MSAFSNIAKDLEKKTENVMKNAVKDISEQSYAHILELARDRLHSTRNKYIDALKYAQVAPDTFVITLDADAMFIEEGLPPNFDMLPGLLNSPKAKTGKKGKYIAVPFQHNKRPQDTAANAQPMNDALRKELKQRKIPYGKIETNENGSPKLGKIHTFSSEGAMKTKEGPFQGQGPVSGSRQGPTGRPYMQGTSVYQFPVPNVGKKMKVEKYIMTFRMASDSQRGKGMWLHPGMIKQDFFGETERWARDKFKEIMEKHMVDILLHLTQI
jgi:hypothetical protein